MPLTFDEPSLVYDVTNPLLIEASAGSGKTTILTERWVAVLVYLLVWEEKDPSEALASMAALTFTRKAAAEMKERIRIRLDEIFASKNLTPFLEQLQRFQPRHIDISQSAQRLSAEKESLDDLLSAAVIGTIDSFVNRSLRQNPLELSEERGLEPDEGKSSERAVQTELLHDCINQAVSGPLYQSFRMGAALCGLTGWAGLLKDLRLKASALGEDALEELLRASDLLKWEKEIRSFSEVSQIFPLCIERPLQKLIACIEDEAQFKQLTAANRELLAILKTIDRENFMSLYYKGLAGPYDFKTVTKEPLDGLRRAAYEASMDLADALTASLMPLMMPMLSECRKRLLAVNRSEGRISFGESERLLLEALRAGPMAEKIQSRIRFFFADEFQDTSRNQHELFSFIAEKAVVFYVGDPKQSIYSFRGAQVSVFSETASEFRNRGWKVEILKKNYRSAEGHVSVVNTIFSEIFKNEPLLSYTPQEAHRSGVPHRFGCTPSPSSAENKMMSADIMQKVYKDALILIRRELLEGLLPEHILVLCHKKTIIKDFYYYLKKHAPELPVSSSVRTGLFESPYVLPVLHFLRAVDNPSDELALAVLLKSIFYRKDDIEINRLLETARGQGRTLYEVLTAQDKAPLERFGALKGRVPLEELVGTLIEETAYEAVLAEERGEALATLRLFQEELQTLYLTQNLSLDAFLALVDEGDYKISEAEASSGEGRNIRIMTIHASKGLESRCVVYIFQDSAVLNHTKLFPIIADGRIAFNVFGKGRLAESLTECEARQKFAEEKRLAYVAATRAGEAFYLCGLPEEKEKDSPFFTGHIFHLGLFRKFFNGNILSDLSWEPLPSGGGGDPPRSYTARRAELEAWESAHPPCLLPETLSVSLLLDAEFSPQTLAAKYQSRGFDFLGSLRDLGEEGFTLAMPSAMDIGTMVHLVLQQFDAASEEEVACFLSQHFPEFESGFDQVLRLTEAYWGSDFYRGLAGSKEQDKERSVQMMLPQGILLRAVADLYVQGNKKIIVDYKLTVDKKLPRYRRQMEYYALMSEKAGYPVDELALFDLSKGEAISLVWDKKDTERAFQNAVEKVLELLK